MKRLFVIFLFFILSWLLYCQVPNELSHFDIDSFGYQDIALNFYYTNQLLDPNISYRAPVQPVGYPFFMGLVYKLFGVRISAIIAMQVALMAIVILLLMAIAALLFGQSVAFIAGLLAALNLGFLVYPQFILAETILLFLFMLFFYFFVCFYKRRSLSALCFSAFILGVSTIIKPTALCFPVLLVPVIVVVIANKNNICFDFALLRSARTEERWFVSSQKMFKKVRISKCKELKKRELTKTVRPERSETKSKGFVFGFVKGIYLALFFVFIFFMPILLYMARNYITYGYFSFAPMMQLNMYQCLLAKVMSRVESVPIQDIIDTQLCFSAKNTFDPRGWEAARNLFYEYLWHYPLTFVSVWLQNVLKTVFGLFSTQFKVLVELAVRGGDCSFFSISGTFFERIQIYIISGITHRWLWWVAHLEALWSGVRWVLVMIGFGFLLFEKKYGLVCIFMLCIVLFSFVTGMDGCCRYRITFEPILILLSAYALEQLRYYKKGTCGNKE